MEKIELLNKYAELTETWMDKQAKLDKYIERWLSGEVQMSSEGVQQLVDSANEQIEQLKEAANQAQSEYLRITNEEAMRKNAVTSVKNRFGVSPDEIIITDGVLSSNANESHLTGRQKTPEELAYEREQLLSDIKSRVMRKEISLTEASKLAHDVNAAYGVKLETSMENTQGDMHR